MARQTPTRDGSADGEKNKQSVRRCFFFRVTRMPFTVSCQALHGFPMFSPFKGFKCAKNGNGTKTKLASLVFVPSVFEIRLDPTWKFECEMPCMALPLATYSNIHQRKSEFFTAPNVRSPVALRKPRMPWSSK